MTAADAHELHLEAEHPDDVSVRAKAALVCFGISIACVIGGFIWLGRAGMLNVKSPDFFPLPHFFAVVGLVLGGFFLFLTWLHWLRFQRFGTSYIDCSEPELGEVLNGTLRVSKTDKLPKLIEITLRCEWRDMRKGMGTGDSARETTEILWLQTQQVGARGAGTGIAFSFALPADGLPSGRRPNPPGGVHPGGNGVIEWYLRAESRHSAALYDAEFLIPVRPGKMLRELAKSVRREKAPRALSERDGGASQAAHAGLSVAARVFGGHVPTQGELDADAEADSRPEPAKPFASSPAPVQPSQSSRRRIGLVLTIILALLLTRELFSQLTFKGMPERATIVETTRELVTLNFGPGDPAHKISVSSFHRWQVGETVTAVCVSADDGKRRCRMQTGYDRWLNSLLASFFVLVAVGLWRT